MSANNSDTSPVFARKCKFRAVEWRRYVATPPSHRFLPRPLCLAMMLFSIFATLSLRKINCRLWLNWYFEACANSGEKSPDDVAEFLPCGLMSLFRGSCLGTHCSRGSCLARLSPEAGASSAVRSSAGALERELTASIQAEWS
ncbi:MAG TPA: hypothetical protein PLR25_03500 [Planctomycetaceae bacterium]|nr:hypothetical protein [Planctomycetaceae bacterium]